MSVRPAAPSAWRQGWDSVRFLAGVTAVVALLIAVVKLEERERERFAAQFRSPEEPARVERPASPAKQRRPDEDEFQQRTDHLEAGMKFTFRMTMDQPTMLITMTEVFEVKAIGTEFLTYDVVTTTQTEMKNPPPGMPPMKPMVHRRQGEKHKLHWKRPEKRLDRPKPVGEETIVVAGIRFECKIYENSGTRSWIDQNRWPLIIRMDGKLKKELVKVERP